MLSIFRLCLVPVFVLVYFHSVDGLNAAVLVYAIASLTDVLDGKIARKYNQTSQLGKFLDPLGDKAMTFTVLLCITIDKVIPLWAVVVFAFKELMMGIGGLVLHKKMNEMPGSNVLGKASTVIFFIVSVILMVFREIPADIANLMIGLAIVVMAAAFFSYLLTFIKIMKSIKKTDNSQILTDPKRRN